MSKQYGYIRVSSTSQSIDRQVDALAAAGYNLPTSQLFVDRQSGKNRDRNQLKTLLETVKRGDIILISSLDRLARNTIDTLTMCQELADKGIGLTVLDNATLSFEANGKITPIQKLMLSVLGSVAELERAMIKERQREGIAAAQARGQKFGRPKSTVTKAEALEALEQTTSKSAAAEALGISRPKLYALLKEAS